MSSGELGATRLDAELTIAADHSLEEELFRIYAADLLFDIRGAGHAPRIARIWKSIHNRSLLTSTFQTAFEAAQTRDNRVLPMLRLWFGAVDLKAFLPAHSLSIAWPQTAETLYLVCGPPCFVDLKSSLSQSTDHAELGSAAYVLSRTLEPEVLPRIRQLALSGSSHAKLQAIQALGWYGHPDDFELLRAGLKSQDEGTVYAHIFALIDFGDLRASEDITPYVDSPVAKIRKEALLSCTYLPTVRSTDILIKRVTEKSNDLEAEFDEQLTALCNSLRMDRVTFLRAWPREKERLISQILVDREKSFDLKAGEPAITREALLQWIQESSLGGHLSGGLSTSQILSQARPEDIPLFVEVKSRLLTRLSDECLYEVQKVDLIVKRLGRARYRKEVGTTFKVQSRH